MAIVPTRREPMPREQVGAKAVKLGEGEVRAHGFLNGDDVNVLVPDVLNKLAATTVMAEVTNVLEKGAHLNRHGEAA